MEDDQRQFPHIAKWAQATVESSLQKALARAASLDVLSLSLGLPGPGLFPMALLAEASSQVLACNRSAFLYALPSPKLKLAICKLMSDRGVECSPEQIFLTSGAQQGLSLLARLLLDRRHIFEEALSYFQQSIEPYLPSIVTIQTSSSTGIDVDSLEQQLARGRRPALIYVMTRTGTILSE